MKADQESTVRRPETGPLLVEIRLVAEHDFPEWLQLRLALWPYHTDEELLVEMHQIFAVPDSTPVFVAVGSGGGILGFAEFSIHESVSWCSTTNVGYVEGWYVRPGCRRSGIGKALLVKGEEWASGRGCTEMASDTTPEYSVSPSAHKGLGFVEAGDPLHFRKTLSSSYFP